MTEPYRSTLWNREAIIYMLIDPRGDYVRYIGQTMDIEQRWKHHCHSPSARTKCGQWILELRKVGLRPTYEVIESAVYDRRTRERFWIDYFRYVGADLLNVR